MKLSLLLLSVLSLTSIPSASASVLTGSSGTFTLPVSTGGPGSGPGVLTTQTGTTNVTYTWGVTANPAWQGTFDSVGNPGSGQSALATITFAGLPGGYLPAGTYLRLSDLDSNEGWTLSALDEFGFSFGSVHFLRDAVHIEGNNAAEFVQGYMPSWSYASSAYTLTGESASGNPAFLLVIQTDKNISQLVLNRANTSNSLSFASGDVPEPATWSLVGVGLVAAGMARRRRRAA